MNKCTAVLLAVVIPLLGVGSVWAAPAVTPPPNPPSWWNQECILYAYGYWENPITPDMQNVSPPNNPSHFASKDFLANTDFKISVTGDTITINLKNQERIDLHKEIYIYLHGTTMDAHTAIELGQLDVAGQTFQKRSWGAANNDGHWTYILDGEIYHQPPYVKLTFTVTSLLQVTEAWAGENCIPEPATLSLMCVALAPLLLRRKR
jgi:hypothetical protein